MKSHWIVSRSHAKSHVNAKNATKLHIQPRMSLIKLDSISTDSEIVLLNHVKSPMIDRDHQMPLKTHAIKTCQKLPINSGREKKNRACNKIPKTATKNHCTAK